MFLSVSKKSMRYSFRWIIDLFVFCAWDGPIGKHAKWRYAGDMPGIRWAWTSAGDMLGMTDEIERLL